MANIVTIQTLMDGEQKVVVRVVGTLDTANVAATDILDPATLKVTNPLTTQLRIDRVHYDVSPNALAVQLLWDATADVIAAQLSGYGDLDATKYGGLQNNAGAGKTGKIQLSTSGFAVAGVFDITVEATKQ